MAVFEVGQQDGIEKVQELPENSGGPSTQTGLCGVSHPRQLAFKP